MNRCTLTTSELVLPTSLISFPCETHGAILPRIVATPNGHLMGNVVFGSWIVAKEHHALEWKRLAGDVISTPFLKPKVLVLQYPFGLNIQGGRISVNDARSNPFARQMVEQVVVKLPVRVRGHGLRTQGRRRH